MRELQERRGYEEIYTPTLVHQKLWERVWATGSTTATNMFLVDVEDQTLQPQADELPGVDVHLPTRGCARTATCRCALANTAGCTATSCPGRSRVSPAFAISSQDDAHIFVRPDQLGGRDRGA